MRKPKIEESYFNGLYASDPDPWRFESSEYEAAKYAVTLAALSDARSSSALEVGCSIGVFTQRLAERCDNVVAIDPVRQALETARRRCEKNANVIFEKMAAPEQWPDQSFDLIVLSEVVYYFTRSQIARLTERVERTLQSDGRVLLVHWLGETDYPLSGDDAVTAFLTGVAPIMRLVRQKRTREYRLDLLQRL